MTRTRKITLALIGTFLGLSFLLIAHIYSVTKATPAQMVQLSRIDFKEKITTDESEKIRGFVGQLPGVHNTYFNERDNVLVYTYEIDKQNSQHVFNQLIAFGHYKAERYVVSVETATSGCPAMVEKLPFMKKISLMAKQLFPS